METENKVLTRWAPNDHRYLSSLRTQEAVKQTRDMILVSGRRKCSFYHDDEPVYNQTHAVQHGDINASTHAQSVMQVAITLYSRNVFMV